MKDLEKIIEEARKASEALRNLVTLLDENDDWYDEIDRMDSLIEDFKWDLEGMK